MPSSQAKLPRLMNIPCTARQTLQAAEYDPPAQLNVLETVAHHPQGMAYGELALTPDASATARTWVPNATIPILLNTKAPVPRLTLASHIHFNMYAKAFPNTTTFPSSCTPKGTHLCPARPASPLLESQSTKTPCWVDIDFIQTYQVKNVRLYWNWRVN